MRVSTHLMAWLALLALTGCGDQAAREAERDANPTFMFFNFRKEIVSDDYHVPEMKTTAAAEYLRARLKTIPGYVDSQYDLSRHILTVSYKGSTIRKMNFEEGIAQAGFAVNRRPAYPNVQLPEGVK